MVSKIENLYQEIEEKENLKKELNYFKNKTYIVIFIKQIKGLIKNLNSIQALLDINNPEDAFTIFRKYLETYLIIMSVIENPSIVNQYIEHDKMIGQKACGVNLERITSIRKNNIDGFIEYGYIKDLIDTSDPNFKYSIKHVAEVGRCKDLYFKGYRPSNNFVHNNLTSVNLDTSNLNKVIKELCDTTIERLYETINDKILK